MRHLSAPAIVTAILALLLCAPAARAEPADAGFDRVFPSDYADALYDGKTAYGDKDYAKAFPLLRKTACAGDKESQWLFGHLYLLGQGVPRNDLVGYGWLKVAAEFQWAEYRSTVEKIEAAVPPAQQLLLAKEAKHMLDEYSMGATHMSCNKSASRKGHIMDRITCTPRGEGAVVLLKRCADPDAPTAP